MVWDHVTQCTGCIIEAAATTDIQRFSDGDLHMIDVIAIPDRLEHAVGETQHQDVLNRLLTEIMIDPVELALLDQLQQIAV